MPKNDSVPIIVHSAPAYGSSSAASFAGILYTLVCVSDRAIFNFSNGIQRYSVFKFIVYCYRRVCHSTVMAALLNEFRSRCTN